MSQDNKSDLAEHYKSKLTQPQDAEGVLIESTGTAPSDDLSSEGIDNRLSATKEELYRIIKEYFNGDKSLYELADRVAKDGRDALSAVRDNDNEFLNRKPETHEALEVIVRTDGSRPSFLIRNGIVDLNSSPVGSWAGVINGQQENLKKTVASVGRINLSGAHQGTGFLIADDLIMTNRHVLEIISRANGSSKPILSPNAEIDFGYEYRGTESYNPRKIVDIVFCGSNPINGRINHVNLDMAILKLGPSDDTLPPQHIFSVDLAPEWAHPDSGSQVFTIGYSADPGKAGITTYTASVLEMLYHMTYGYKRLAPGAVMKSPRTVQSWTATHDATTLGGNSGSIIVRVGRELIASGLHYGGNTQEPRENWGHTLAKTLSAPNFIDGRKLQDVLTDNGVKMVDNF